MDSLAKEYSYTAGGQKVTLRPDAKYVGVKLDQLDAVQVAQLEDTAKGKVRKVSDGAAMVPRRNLTRETMKLLEEHNALFPVFIDGSTSIIALPEVRVEQGDGADESLNALNKWVGKHKKTVRVVAVKPGRMVLAPTSNYGPDAVSLAQDITLNFKSFSASPRLLRVVENPKTA